MFLGGKKSPPNHQKNSFRFLLSNSAFLDLEWFIMHKDICILHAAIFGLLPAVVQSSDKNIPSKSYSSF